MPKRPVITPEQVHKAIAKSLTDFGYPDVTPAMIEEIARAYQSGKRGTDLPHGIVGRFAEDQLAVAVASGVAITTGA